MFFFAFPKSIGPMIMVMWWKSRWSEFIMIMNLTGCCLDRFKVLGCEFEIMKILVDLDIMSPDILFPWQSITHRTFVLSIVSICNITPHNNRLIWNCHWKVCYYDNKHNHLHSFLVGFFPIAQNNLGTIHTRYQRLKHNNVWNCTTGTFWMIAKALLAPASAVHRDSGLSSLVLIYCTKLFFELFYT